MNGYDVNVRTVSSEERCIPVEHIDMATGYVLERRTDFSLSGRLPLLHKRFYHSGRMMSPGLLGARWRCLWDMSLLRDGESVIFTDEQYNQGVYSMPAAGSQSRVSHMPQWRLLRRGDDILMRHVDGLSYRFGHAFGDRLLLSRICDGKGNEITFTYHGAVLSHISLADGRQVRLDTHLGRIKQLTLLTPQALPIQTLVRYEYNQLGYMTSCRADPGANFDYRYSRNGFLLRSSDLSLTWLEFDYDVKGRALAIRGAGERFDAQLRYDDEQGVVYYKSARYGISHYHRDERDNITRIVFSNGDETVNEWQDHCLIAQINARGESCQFTYNDFGQVTAMTIQGDQTWEYIYDDSGRLTQYINSKDELWSYRYDNKGNLVSVSDPFLMQWFYQYTSLGQLAWIISPDASQTGYRYNRLGELVTIFLADGGTVVFHYDGLGRLVTRCQTLAGGSKEGTQFWQYKSGMPYPCAWVDEDGHQTNFAYDCDGHLIGVTNSQGLKHDYEYGAFDTLISHVTPQGRSCYQYNHDCQLLSVSEAKQVEDSTLYFHSHQGQAVQALATQPVMSQQSRIVFAYDAAGRLESKTLADGTSVHFYYDAIGRLVQQQSRTKEGRVDTNIPLECDEVVHQLKVLSPDAALIFEYEKLAQNSWRPKQHT
ncbi:DUF6531 domain-containing protein [Shewanella benthica]|nr:DUF6531 domain-containing protein [Shewanella benthica]